MTASKGLLIHLWTSSNHPHICGKTRWEQSIPQADGGPDPLPLRQNKSGTEVVSSQKGEVVWQGDPHLPPPQQGMRVLGVPIGEPEFIKEFLVKKSREPWVNGPQAAYLLLLMSGSTSANFSLREEWRCRSTRSAPMDGGLGLASAHRMRTAAHFASWADSLNVVRKRHPHIAATMIRNLEAGTSPSVQLVLDCKRWWWMPGSMCLPGTICRCRVQRRRQSWSPTNPSLGGNNRRQGRWRRTSFLTIFWPK